MSSASTSKPAESTPEESEPKKDGSHLHLGVLEEDEKFEEFGKRLRKPAMMMRLATTRRLRIIAICMRLRPRSETGAFR
jgi:hypothetical protein